jgi:hypothetical protein
MGDSDFSSWVFGDFNVESKREGPVFIDVLISCESLYRGVDV